MVSHLSDQCESITLDSVALTGQPGNLEIPPISVQVGHVLAERLTENSFPISYNTEHGTRLRPPPDSAITSPADSRPRIPLRPVRLFQLDQLLRVYHTSRVGICRPDTTPAHFTRPTRTGLCHRSRPRNLPESKPSNAERQHRSRSDARATASFATPLHAQVLHCLRCVRLDSIGL